MSIPVLSNFLYDSNTEIEISNNKHIITNKIV